MTTVNIAPALTSPDSGLPESFESVQWELTDCSKTRFVNDEGRRLCRGVFRSARLPRRGCYEVSVFFWAHRPRAAIRKQLAAGTCPIRFHNLEID